jgi:hypothetical protein
MMRSPHEFHGVFNVTPLFGFIGVTPVLASLGILGRLGDSLEAVLLKHLPRDAMNLYLGYHLRSPDVALRPEPQEPCWGVAEPEFWFGLAACDFMPPFEKEEGDLATFSFGSGGTIPLLSDRAGRGWLILCGLTGSTSPRRSELSGATTRQSVR